MHDRARIARRRIAATLLFAALGVAFACKPTWSPDGKQLACSGIVDGEVELVHYDLEQHSSRVVFPVEHDSRLAAVRWLADGRLVVLRCEHVSDKKLTLTVGAPTDAEPRTFEVPIDADASNHMVDTPVVVGGSLLLGGPRLRRVDLEDGSVTVGPPFEQENVALSIAPRGDGACYLRALGDATEGRWQVGAVDVATLQTKALFDLPGDSWRPTAMPVFTSDLQRAALSVMRGTDDAVESVILVFRDGELENELRIGGENERVVGRLCWAPDDVTILGVVARQRGRREVDLLLHEATFSGSVARDTVLLEGVPASDALTAISMMVQVAISPDGARAAATTAFLEKLPQERHGLLLVDLRDKDRAVTRLPFPTR